MKILKPGKVEQRKFVCPRCRCLFVASYYETKLENGRWGRCPHCGKANKWNDGEPYEEPTPTQTDRDRLKGLLRLCGCWQCDETRLDKMTDILINNGVTFKEG